MENVYNQIVNWIVNAYIVGMGIFSAAQADNL